MAHGGSKNPQKLMSGERNGKWMLIEVAHLTLSLALLMGLHFIYIHDYFNDAYASSSLYPLL